MGAHFEALDEGVLRVPLDPRYTQVGFNLISVQVCLNKTISCFQMSVVYDSLFSQKAEVDFYHFGRKLMNQPGAPHQAFFKSSQNQCFHLKVPGVSE